MIYLGKDGTVDGQRPKQLNQTFPDDRVVVGVTKLNLKRGCEKRCEPGSFGGLCNDFGQLAQIS